MSRLVVFSNRVPLGDKPSSGLVVALNDTMISNGGLWVGSETLESAPTENGAALKPHLGASFERLTMGLTRDEHAQYYLGYSNSVLWPLFHGRADIALVTPLNDGMNLVAQEYVAAQDPEDPGVLIRSRFAGAAEQLAEGAILINPYDAASISEAIATAVAMPLEARQARHAAMWDQLTRYDNDWWTGTFLRTLGKAALSRRTSESFFIAAGE
ncbi:MAG: trehalose-6-phosphate synthase [Hyphomonas sp.]